MKLELANLLLEQQNTPEQEERGTPRPLLLPSLQSQEAQEKQMPKGLSA